MACHDPVNILLSAGPDSSGDGASYDATGRSRHICIRSDSRRNSDICYVQDNCLDDEDDENILCR